MTDRFIITIYAGLAAFIIAAAVSFAVRRIHDKLSRAYYGICACLLGWLLTDIGYHIVDDPDIAVYLDNLAFPFIAFLPVMLLMFITRFYRGNKKIRNKTTVLLCIIPVITSVIAICPSLGWLLRTEHTMIQLVPINISGFHWNIWYYIHIVYSYLLMGVATVIVLWQYKKQPMEYKRPSALMLLCLVIAYLSDMPFLGLSGGVFDNTLIGVSISMVVLYIAIINNPVVEFLAVARKALYNNLELPVFILDKRGYILDMNQAAHSLSKALGTADIPHLIFQNITDAVSEAGGIFREGYVDDDETHILMRLNGENIVLKQLRRKLFDRKGRLMGSYIAMVDITRLSHMINELQRWAEVDSLTGIPNRRAFEERKKELDTPENLPISLIMGDVNGLKRINDTQGHAQGDRLLKAVANTLVDASPESGFAARLGGDEFVIIAPRCDEADAEAIVKSIREGLKKKYESSEASIALGFITKTAQEQNIDDLLGQADQRMYSQKIYDRRGRA